MEYYHYIITILAGIIVVGVLGYKLYLKFKPYADDGTWYIPVAKVISYMAEAETKFEKGADRKEWVMNTLEEAMGELKIDVDYDAISNMIDSICALSKVINKK